MSYYMQKFIPLEAGTPGWQFAPVPGWGVNPAAAGPPRIGVGCATGRCAGMGAETATTEASYKQATWGEVLLAGAGALIVGVLIGWVAHTASKPKRMAQNRRRKHSGVWKKNGSVTAIRGRRGGLTAASRSRMPASAFVFPEKRTWPIGDRYHAIKALQYAKWPQHKARRDAVVREVARRWGRDPEVRDKIRQYFPRASSRYLRAAA